MHVYYMYSNVFSIVYTCRYLGAGCTGHGNKYILVIYEVTGHGASYVPMYNVVLSILLSLQGVHSLCSSIFGGCS